MSEESFDRGDLYGLEVCLRDLDEMLTRAGDARTDKAVAYAIVKCFELTYELAIKTLRKYVIARTHEEEAAREYDRPDFVRLADQLGAYPQRMAGMEGLQAEQRQDGPHLQPAVCARDHRGGEDLFRRSARVAG